MTNDSGRKREIAASFGGAADQYLASDVHRSGADLDRLASWCSNAETALDVATGAGHAAAAVADRGVPTVVATDASPAMVATAVRSFDGVDGAVADAERLPFENDAFDAVTCRIAAHHFPDPERFVGEVARVLRPGGVFAFEDTVAPDDAELGAFVNRVERLRDPTHVESHPTERWHEWLADSGFEIEATERLKTTLAFDPWVDRRSVPPERRDRIEEVLTAASARTRSFFEVRTEGGAVRSFANLKALVRARRLA